MRRLIAAGLAAVALLTGCASNNQRPLQVSDDLRAATPAQAPQTRTAPRGTVVDAPAADHLLLLKRGHTLVMAAEDRATLNVFDTRALDKAPRTIRLPRPPSSLSPTADGTALLATLPNTDTVATVRPDTGRIERTTVKGGPVDAIRSDAGLVVARRDRDDVIVVDNGRITRRIEGFPGVGELLPHDNGQKVLVLDQLTTSLTPIDPDTGETEAALRVGEGATNAVSDRFGRVLAVDTRGEEIMAFATDPLIMKQRYPAPESPYGLAYTPSSDLAWVTSTARNELVGYDVAGEQPRQVEAVPTVRQPNTVAVDPSTGAVYVASATGAGLQVVKP